jgi:hypothetical protein
VDLLDSALQEPCHRTFLFMLVGYLAGGSGQLALACWGGGALRSAV